MSHYPQLLKVLFRSTSKHSRKMSGMLLDGERVSGQDVRTQNVTAAVAIANIVKTSLGPVGLDKMLVDEIGDGKYILVPLTS